MGDLANALVAPLAMLGAAAAIAVLIAPMLLSHVPRPYLMAWSVASLFLGAAMICDQLGHAQSFGLALARGLETSAAIGALVSLIWLRQNRWDVFDRRQDGRRQAERHAHYRSRSLVE